MRHLAGLCLKYAREREGGREGGRGGGVPVSELETYLDGFTETPLPFPYEKGQARKAVDLLVAQEKGALDKKKAVLVFHPSPPSPSPPPSSSSSSPLPTPRELEDMIHLSRRLAFTLSRHKVMRGDGWNVDLYKLVREIEWETRRPLREGWLDVRTFLPSLPPSLLHPIPSFLLTIVSSSSSPSE